MCIIVNRRMKRHIFLLLCMVAVVLTGCNNAKLSVANEQYERGEYYDASVTYKKVYNKLRKKEERPLRGQVAYQLATCYRLLNMSTRAGAAYQNALHTSIWHSRSTVRVNMPLPLRSIRRFWS